MRVIACRELGVEGIETVFPDGICGSIVLVKGPPGAGKTTFGIQFVYTGLRNNEKVLYVSTLETFEEFLEKAVVLGMDLSVYVNKGFYYFHISLHGGKENLLYVLDNMMNLVTREKVSRIVIDSIDMIQSMLSAEEFYSVLTELIDRVKKSGAMLLLIREILYRVTRISPFEEYSDIVIELNKELRGDYELKYLTVTKSRYTRYVPARIPYEITKGGIRIHSPYKYLKVFRGTYDETIISTGIKELDQMLGGGIPVGSITIIKGPIGTYKTLLALTIAINNVIRGKRVWFTSYKESRDQILKYIKQLGHNFKDLEDRLIITSVNPIYSSPTALYTYLIEYLSREKPDLRISLGVETLLDLVEETERKRFIVMLLNTLKALNITEIIVYTYQGNVLNDPYGLDKLADTLIATRYTEKDNSLIRQIAVIRNRGASYIDNRYREILFSNGRIVIK